MIYIIEWYLRRLIRKIAKLLVVRDILSNHSTRVDEPSHYFVDGIRLINYKIERIQEKIIFWSKIIDEIKI